jgi:metallo-beta-lactamase class B
MKRVLLANFVFFLCINLFPQEEPIISISENLQIVKLKEDFYQYTSFKVIETYGKIGGNGLVVLSDSGAVIIDTPWDNELSMLLINYVENELNSKIKIVVVTHSHDDCAGGLQVFYEKGIKSIGHLITRQKLLDGNNAYPEEIFSDTLSFLLGDKFFELYYPGAGHAIDNITVWVKPDKVLFGGCLIKALENSSIGNITDADLKEWPLSIKRVLQKYYDAEIVIPGHGMAGSKNLLEHSLILLENQQ